VVSVVFVCLGNICRSPTAEGIFRHLVENAGLDEHIHIDSAGTHSFHVGSPPDGNAQAEARRHGIDISHLRGRQAKSDDFQKFDYVLAMDSENHRNLLSICPDGSEHKLHIFLNFAPAVGLTDVPDPYYEGGFDSVYDMIEKASHGLLADIQENHL